MTCARRGVRSEEEEEQTWMEENNRRKEEVMLRKQKMLETFVQAVEAIPRDPVATSSSNPGASSSGASDHGGHYGGDPAFRGTS